MKKPSTNVQKVEIMLLKELIMFRNKDKNAVIDAPICMKHQSIARKETWISQMRGIFLSVNCLVSIIQTISCAC